MTALISKAIIETAPTRKFEVPPQPMKEARNKKALSANELERSIIHRINTCTATRELYERASATPIGWDDVPKTTGPWNFKFVEETSSTFEAQCRFETRTVELSLSEYEKLLQTDSPTEVADRALAAALFELTNAIHFQALDDLDIEAFAKGKEIARMDLREREAMIQKISSGLAKKAEAIEHAGTALHHVTIQAGIREGKLKESMDIFAETLVPFEERWAEIESSPHAEHWRDVFRKTIRDGIAAEEAVSLVVSPSLENSKSVSAVNAISL